MWVRLYPGEPLFWAWFWADAELEVEVPVACMEVFGPQEPGFVSLSHRLADLRLDEYEPSDGGFMQAYLGPDCAARRHKYSVQVLHAIKGLRQAVPGEGAPLLTASSGIWVIIC
jgi:hypothetical protein